MAATNSPITNNAAMAGCLGGMASGRQPVVDAAGTVMQPADFALQVATSETLAVEEQVALGASFATAGGLPAYFTNTGNVGASLPASLAAGTAAEANAYSTLPVAMMLLGMASFDNQPNPSDATGTITDGFFAAQANAFSSVFAYAVFNNHASGGFTPGTNFVCSS
jgi:hypothetical protein